MRNLLVKLSVFLALFSALFSENSFAQTSISLNIYYNTTPGQSSYYIQVPITTSNVILTSYEVHSPHSDFISTYSPSSGQFNETLVNLTQFNDLINEITNGDWSFITDVGSPSETTYTFHVSATGFTSNTMPGFQITNPTPEQTDVSSNVTFMWSGGPTNYSSLNVDVYNNDFSYAEGFVFTPAVASDFTPSDPLGGDDTNFTFTVNYGTSGTNYLTISTPTTGFQPLAGWSSTSTLNLTETINFTTGSGNTNGTGHSLVAHFTFDDPNHLGVDSSGHGNDYNSGGGQNGGGSNPTTNAEVGGGAIQFTRNDSDYFSAGYQGWDPTPPTQILSTLAGSFSVAVWVKTTSSIGNTNDAGYNGSAVLAADVSGSALDTLPIALTGGYAAFTTGGGTNQSDQTIHSTTAVNNGSFHQIVVTRDQLTGLKSIYVDGQLQATGTGVTDLLNDPKSVVIGAVNDAGQNFTASTFYGGYDGIMDDLQIYTGVLNASEVTTLFNNPGTTAPDVSNSDLVAHYTFDNSTNIGMDTSGNGYNLDFSGDDGAILSTNAEAGGGAAYFDGNAFLTYNHTPSAVLAAFASNFTLSFWISTTQPSGDGDTDEAYAGEGIVAADIPKSVNDIVPAALTGHTIGFNTGPDDDTINSTASVTDGAYHHVVVTRNQLTGDKQIFVDNVLSASDTDLTNLLNDPMIIAIGAQIDASNPDPDTADTGNNFTGLLDDIQIYSRVLSTDEISFLFHNPGSTIGVTSVVFAPVSLDFRLSIFRQRQGSNDVYFAFPGFDSVSPFPTTTNRISSPHGFISGEKDSNGDGGAGSPDYSSLGDLLQECTNGQWTLTINQGDPSQQVFHFTVSIAGLTTNILTPTIIFAPLDGSTNVATNSPFQWYGPVTFSDLNVSKHLSDDSDSASADFPLNVTNWPSPPGLDIGTNFFGVTYKLNSYTNVSISTPVNGSLQPVASFSSTVELDSTANSQFVVVASSSPIRLVNVQSTNGNFQFSFTAASGHNYTVQSNTNLASHTWSPYTNFTGDGTVKNITVPAATPSQQFFRVNIQ